VSADGAVTALEPGTQARVQRRTVWTLVSSQVLGGIGVGSGFAVGSLVAEDVSGSTFLAGLAQTASVLGAAVAAVPMSRAMGRFGRRPGLVGGYVAGAAGAAIVIASTVIGSFPLMLVGALLFGASSATNLQARYAATDLAVPTRRARALAIVMWATTIGAVLGPNLAGPGAWVAAPLGLVPLVGPFVFSLVVFALAGLVLWVRLRPDPLVQARLAQGGADPAARTASLSMRASWRLVRSTPAALLATVGIVVAHTVMVAVMVMTPVHMRHGGDSLRVVGLVISGHVLGMYAFSPIVGWLADRFGAVTVLLAGQGVLVLACLLAGTAGHGHTPQLAIGLLLLGLGWSFGLVAGSALLSDAIAVDARPSVQGLVDFLMGVAGASGGAVAGLVVGGWGFGWLALMSAMLIVPVLVAAMTLRRRLGVSSDFEQVYG
jgi:MFS family permease